MSLHLKKVTELITKSESLSSREKTSMLKELGQEDISAQEKETMLATHSREFEIEATLDRIRFQALAMRTSDDLPEVSKVSWKQMEILGQEVLE